MIKMTCLTKTLLLLLALVTLVKAGVFDKSFLIRMEDITTTNKELTETNRNLSNTNEELTDINRELNNTVIEQKEMMANFTSTIEDLKAINAAMDTTIATLNSTLAQIISGEI